MKKDGDRFLSYPLVLEGLVWLFYVAMYKYSYFLEQGHFPPTQELYFPHTIVCIYALCSSLYLIFYYRYLVPSCLSKRRYLWLLGLTFMYIVIIGTLNNHLIAFGFASMTSMPEQAFFATLQYGPLDWNLITTDSIAFLAVGFSIFSFRNEVLRRKMETEHLQLQLHLLKAQLQPHFLFNALHGLHAISLTNAQSTSKFILLLADLMQYILHDASQEQVSLTEEVHFMRNYFEFERLRFPKTDIALQADIFQTSATLPPLLFLPLMENSFKHGKQTAIDQSYVHAELQIERGWLIFRIENERMPPNHFTAYQKTSGIGLNNLEKRLERYYPDRYQLLIQKTENTYIAKLKIKL